MKYIFSSLLLIVIKVSWSSQITIENRSQFAQFHDCRLEIRSTHYLISRNFDLFPAANTQTMNTDLIPRSEFRGLKLECYDAATHDRYHYINLYHHYDEGFFTVMYPGAGASFQPPASHVMSRIVILDYPSAGPEYCEPGTLFLTYEVGAILSNSGFDPNNDYIQSGQLRRF